MFVLTTTHSHYRHHLYDIDTLEDVVIGLTGDEAEARRIAAIAGQMRLGDGFATPGMMLTCEEEK